MLLLISSAGLSAPEVAVALGIPDGTPCEQRATMLRALSMIPSLTVTPGAVTVAGRTGVTAEAKRTTVTFEVLMTKAVVSQR